MTDGSGLSEGNSTRHKKIARLEKYFVNRKKEDVDGLVVVDGGN